MRCYFRQPILVKRALMALCLLASNLPLFADPLITQKQSSYLSQLPSTSFATMSSQWIKITRKSKKNYRIFIPAEKAIALTVTHNKNPILAESIPAGYVRQLFVVDSKNSFNDYPIDAQVIINNHAQSVRLTAINVSPTGIEVFAKAYVDSRPIQEEEGEGIVVVNSSCIKNRVVCALGCTYVIIPDIECRQKLGIR